jgi:hypothetical protein
VTRSKAAVLTSVVVILVLFAWAGIALAHVTDRVSVNSGGTQGNNGSSNVSVSGDGTLVAFESAATNLVAGDTNGAQDVFVRNRLTGTTIRVSVAGDGTQANGSSYSPSISRDGRYVAFSSLATNLVSGDTNGKEDVFVRDLVAGTTERVSILTPIVQGNNTSTQPSISSGGRYVTFASYADNLVLGDTNGKEDIFVRDRTSGITTLVSSDSSWTQGNDDSYLPFISGDGNYVTFQSNASNLVSGDTNGAQDVFIRNVGSSTTERVSVRTGGTQGDNHSFSCSISGNGDFVVFSSSAANLVSGDSNGKLDVFVRDRVGNSTSRVSVDGGGNQGNNDSYFGSVSSDGRYVAFGSDAGNLVSGDTNGKSDVFVRDRLLGSTTRVSTNSGYVQGNGQSVARLSISADGCYVGFGSVASNLVSNDTNGLADAFVAVNRAVATSYESLRGTDRYDTAIKISKAMFASALPAGSGLVLAPGETYQEALCGAPLAAAYGGPVLLTYQAALANNVKAELQRLAPTYVVCIGLSSGVVNAVKAALPAATVTAINGAGGSVYDMSYKVAMALVNKVVVFVSPNAIICMGTAFPDAIAVSPLACVMTWPILLTDSVSGPLNASAAQFLTDSGFASVLKAGTYCTLPPGIIGTANLSGADRYYTNANVAYWAKTNEGSAFTHTGFATGDKFPDALASGPYLAQWNGILLLSPLAGPLPTPIKNMMILNATKIVYTTFIAMVEPVVSQVKLLLP